MFDICFKKSFEMLHAFLLLVQHFCPNFIFKMPGPTILIMAERVEAIRDLASPSLVSVVGYEIKRNDWLYNIPFIAGCWRSWLNFWLFWFLGALFWAFESTFQIKSFIFKTRSFFGYNGCWWHRWPIIFIFEQEFFLRVWVKGLHYKIINLWKSLCFIKIERYRNFCWI